MLPRVTLECKAMADPELRFTQSGIAMCTIRTGSFKQKKDDAGQWVDDKKCWLSVTCWRDVAEHVAESIVKGDLLVVTGLLETQEWEDRNGAKRSNVQVLADSVAADLRFRTIPHGAGRTERASAPAANDPWATTGGGSDDPPF